MRILITSLGMQAASLDLMDRVGWLNLALYHDLNKRATDLGASGAARLAA
jgi:hypothetical protein